MPNLFCLVLHLCKCFCLLGGQHCTLLAWPETRGSCEPFRNPSSPPSLIRGLSHGAHLQPGVRPRAERAGAAEAESSGSISQSPAPEPRGAANVPPSETSTDRPRGQARDRRTWMCVTTRVNHNVKFHAARIFSGKRLVVKSVCSSHMMKHETISKSILNEYFENMEMLMLDGYKEKSKTDICT